MKAKWLICLYDEDCIKIAHTAELLGYEVKSIGKYDNLEGKHWADAFDKNDCVVFMGSLQFARDVQKAALYGVMACNPEYMPKVWHQWVPGAICDFEFFKYKHYSQYIKNELLNWPYTLCTEANFFHMKDFLYSTHGNSDCIFVRPDSGFKNFTGLVVHEADFLRCYDTFDPYNDAKYDSSDRLVIVSEPANILKEYRLIVVDKKVVAGSTYRVYGNLESYNVENCPEYNHLVQYAEKIAEEIPHGCYVMDVALTQSVDYKVVELNSFSCSGMYDCDMKKVIPAVSAWAEKQWEEWREQCADW